MSDWSPLVVIVTAILYAAIVVLGVVLFNIRRVVSTHDKNKSVVTQDPGYTEPMMPEKTLDLHLAEEESHVQAEDIQAPVLLPPPNPALQVAQDNLNYTLWHQMRWLIPNANWIQTQHQSLADVQWLCLGPDHQYFIAHAELSGDQWKWTFTKA